MAKDSQHENVLFTLSEIRHHYGENVHILSDPYHLGLLAKLCHPQTFQPQINYYVEKIYGTLFSTMVNMFFPRAAVLSETRMIASHPQEGIFEGQVTQSDCQVVCVNLARAGTFPSHICYEAANHFFPPSEVRQDHFYVNRKTNANGEVVGVNMSGSKVGGGVDGAYVVIPDPMGATGGTMSHVLSYYKNEVQGKAEKFVALHLIITPEYIKRMKTLHPDLIILSLRLDRGLSPLDVLNATPGKFWEREKGLNENQYIIPGGGGLGEVLNNSFV